MDGSKHHAAVLAYYILLLGLVLYVNIINYN